MAKEWNKNSSLCLLCCIKTYWGYKHLRWVFDLNLKIWDTVVGWRGNSQQMEGVPSDIWNGQGERPRQRGTSTTSLSAHPHQLGMWLGHLELMTVYDKLLQGTDHMSHRPHKVHPVTFVFASVGNSLCTQFLWSHKTQVTNNKELLFALHKGKSQS